MIEIRSWLLALGVMLLQVSCCRTPAAADSTATADESPADTCLTDTVPPACSVTAEAATWQAGIVLDPLTIQKLNADSLFKIRAIDSTLLQRISGRSYQPGLGLHVSRLRYLQLLHINAEGRTQTGELICNRRIASDLLQIFRTLYDSAYVIERMVLVDDYEADDLRSMAANNTSCFNYRTVSGTGRLSRHATGMAVDINPRYNPCIDLRSGSVQPAAGAPYAHDRDTCTHPMLIRRGDLCHRLFRQYGFRWGGDWPASVGKRDYQHFAR
ncbi:MAG: M15 family metallopeptidase [Paludibacteraceae bacterium]|nr:M15 family metallopeptidase [Paludibacteraceae bacterium]